jgi:hypothetical protein
MILWLIYILLDAGFNWWLIEKKKTEPDYLWLTIGRWFFMILTGISVPIEDEAGLGLWVLYTSTSFWIFFDLLINWFRKKPVFYRGENSKIDQFGNKFPIPYFILKLAALGGMAVAIINLLK